MASASTAASRSPTNGCVWCQTRRTASRTRNGSRRERNNPHINSPYPLDVVPLFPEFLNRRRAKWTYPMRVMEELGLDRPALFFVINLSYQPDEGARLQDMGNPYPTIFDANLAAASAARGAGLVDEVGGRWRLTPKGRELAANFRSEVGSYFATLEPIPRADLARLASLLAEALAAIERSDLPKDHVLRVARYRGDGKTAMGALDDAIFGLWQARDDCHMAAWRAAGFSGPVFDVLTRVWRKEAATEAELATKLPGQRPADVASALEKLRADGMVRKDALETTAQGSSVRQQIEDETDRKFFEPWPDRVGREGSWIRERLAAVNAALAPS